VTQFAPHAATPAGTGDDSRPQPTITPEQFITLTVAALMLGIPLFKLRRAAKLGIFKSYRVGNRRILVRLSEVIEAIERSAMEVK